LGVDKIWYRIGNSNLKEQPQTFGSNDTQERYLKYSPVPKTRAKALPNFLSPETPVGIGGPIGRRDWKWD
jgi:hypothetical protein